MEKRKEEYKRNSINVHQRLGTDTHVTQEEMDTERKNTRVYDYLCRLEEAKSWIGRISDIPESYEEFEEEMRKGVYLAEVAKYYAPGSVGSIFVDPNLQYRHTDNINFFLKGLQEVGLPKYFQFEVIDLYEKKNFPKVVYCIHALAHFLEAKGVAGGIESARGRVFSKSDMERLDSEIDKIKMPEFGQIKKDMNEEIGKTEADNDNNEEEEFNSLRRRAEEELLRAGEELSDEDLSQEKMEDRIVLKIKAFLCAKAFEDIYFRKNVTLFSIRKFLFIFFKASDEMIKEMEIDELHRKINKKLKDIYKKEVYLESVENRIRLMISNKLDLHRIKARPHLGDLNLKPLEDVLHRLLTYPKYFSRLLLEVEDKEAFISSTVLPIFSGVKGKKEEYLFIKLVLEVQEADEKNHTRISHLLMLNYFRESKVFREGLYAIVKNLENIEVECNPTEIHRSLFGKEVAMDVALENERVKETMTTRLMVVRGVLSSIVHFLESNIDNIPYILRYFLKTHGAESFFSDYVSQFLLVPDAFNADLGISKSLRGKIYKITQLMNYLISRDLWDETDMLSMSSGEFNGLSEDAFSFYSPIFPFLSSLSLKYKEVISSLVNVSSLDNYFQLESLNEMVRLQKSVVYLRVKTINSLTLLLRNSINLFDPGLADLVLLLEILPDENNFLLALTLLNSDIHLDYNANEVALENYLRSTKKKLIYLLKISGGRNLLDLLTRDSTPEEKELFLRVKDEEMLQKVKLDLPLGPDSLEELKETLNDDLKFLESKELVSKANLYSEILSMLAQDIVLLRFMSQERTRELRTNELTLTNLLSKEEYLDLKTQEYDEYLHAYSSRMASRIKLAYSEDSPILTLSKESPYGSYHFTAEDLIDLGILHQIYDVPDNRDVFFILLSDSPLSFSLEVYINNLLISSPFSFRLEDILLMKKKSQEVFDVLGICSFNTNAFVKLLNDRYIAI